MTAPRKIRDRLEEDVPPGKLKTLRATGRAWNGEQPGEGDITANQYRRFMRDRLVIDMLATGTPHRAIGWFEDDLEVRAFFDALLAGEMNDPLRRRLVKRWSGIDADPATED